MLKKKLEGEPGRSARIARQTAETRIELELLLDGRGNHEISTGIGFFDHMLSTLARHGSLDLRLKAEGDGHVDEHHLVEDVGICLGRAILEALGEKRGIARFGDAHVPMDEALARAVLDLSGRSGLVFQAEFSREAINGFALETVREFFQAVANEGRMTLHLALLYGTNAHHQADALFKSFACALKGAVRLSGDPSIPSTKGTL
jgi:imidazoleglycerol-phosphate dehydratase